MTTVKNLRTIQKKLSNKTLILGVGNDMKGDDGVGPWIVDQLKVHYNCINCSTVPENYISDIITYNPNLTIIIDAALMGAEPGSVRIFPASEIANIHLSSHSMPLSIMAKYIKNQLGCEVYLIGIEPQKVEFGIKMSKIVKSSAKEIVDLLKQSRPNKCIEKV